ncbi:MAG TPA: hypothetical protein DCW51_01170 [Clostridium sp.]|nr:hypothetical protein [Clostridium sp.]
MNNAELERETLKTANEYMNNLISGVKYSVELLYGGNETEGFSMIPSICEGIQWITQVLVLTGNKNKDLVDILFKKLEEIVESFENKDYILVADLLNYELLQVLEDIKMDIEENLD